MRTAFLVLLLALAACAGQGGPPPPKTHTLQVSFGGSGSGAVTATPPGGQKNAAFSQSYPEGTAVTLSASPAAGSRFLGWQGDCSGSGDCKLTLDADKQVTAVFQALASGRLTVYGPADFVGNTLTVDLPALKLGDYVALVPVYATQDASPDALTYSIQTQNLVAPAPAVGPQGVASAPTVPGDAAVVEASRRLVAGAEARGLRPLGVGPQSFGKCPGPYTVGSTQCPFWVIRDRTASPPTQVKITATVQKVSPHAVWLVEDGLTGDNVLSSTELDALVQKFESGILQAVTGAFGGFQDFDNNGKILIVFSKYVGQGGLFGYVYSADLYPDGKFPGVHSNEGDIFYATTPGPAINTYRWPRADFLGYALPGTMAHELKHLVATGYRVKNGQPLEEAWVEEPSAEVAKELAGYGTAYGRIQPGAKAALAAPENFRIVHASRPTNATEEKAMYDFNFLLLWRLHETASAGFWKSWVQSGKTGIANLEAQTGKGFPDLLVDWALTLLFDHTGLLSGYGYAGFNLRDKSWQALGYHPLGAVANASLRSMAFYVGHGQGADARVTFTVDQPAKVRVAVVRFAGPLGY